METQPDRPHLRPPIALLCICDDGKLDGEWVRLRGDRYVIGRTEGDICIPHDVTMSSQHAEISRQGTREGYRWLLRDLHSANGTFARISSAILRHSDEVLIGRGRYRFEAAESAAMVEEARNPVPATLVELAGTGSGQHFTLTLPEYWIGRDREACRIARPDDLVVSPRHARLYRDVVGQWHIENNQSFNGVWFRVEEFQLASSCQFRLGEQRFVMRLV
ncbi:MAG: FHA domain-containing protein [Gemmataceae bacterium]|nr:FHA domain-containing protein [Gemmataceae bacterium]